MTEDRDKERPSLIPGRESGELLDLVRSAEEGATVATNKGPPSARTESARAPEQPAEEFVDVGDEAVEVRPSNPGMALPPGGAPVVQETPARESPVNESPAKESLPPEEDPGRASGMVEKPRPPPEAPRRGAPVEASTRETNAPPPRGLPPSVAIPLLLALAIAALALLAR